MQFSIFINLSHVSKLDINIYRAFAKAALAACFHRPVYYKNLQNRLILALHYYIVKVLI